MEPERQISSVFEFHDPRQRWIYEKLRELVGPAPAAFFRDACWIMANPGVLETSAHLIAHCLREVDELFRMVLAPAIGKNKKLSTKEEVEEILGLLDSRELSNDKREELMKFWSVLYRDLSRLAHKQGTHAIRDIEEIHLLWKNTLLLFDVLLRAIRPHFLNWIAILDELLNKSKSNLPSERDFTTLTHYIPANIVTYQYFFGRLENPGWLEPLWDKGFFKHPPLPVRDKEEGTIRFPPWPEARYLARMAKHKPELVAKIIREMGDTENASVQSDLVDAALAMPPEISITLVEKMLKWAESTYLLLPEKLGALIAYWAKDGKTKEALRLASVLLDVLPDERPASTAGEGLYSLPPEPKVRFDVWHYEQILKQYYPELIRAAPFPALRLLCHLLDKAIRFSLRQKAGQEDEDLSAIWCPAIEEPPQNTGRDIRKVLVTGLRDAAEITVESGKVPLEEVITFLESSQWKVFRRISLHLLRIFHEQAKELIAPRLTDHTLFEDVSVQHEYILLLRECFSSLSPDNQETILKWIEEGPDIERFREWWQRERDRTPSEEEISHYCEIWQRDRLAWIGPENLPKEWRERYRTLVQQYGEPEHPAFPVYMEVGWVGPTSPKSAEELKSMLVEEIVTFLLTWQPPENVFREPSPEGFGRVLASVVAEEPRRFAEQAERFRGLDPTYVRSLFYGLREALEKHKGIFNWLPILQLCQWVIAQPREIPGRRFHRFEKDPTWEETRKAIARLLEAGFQKKAGEIPIAYREKVWAIVEQLTKDPDPTPEDESLASMSPATLSINTTRDTAMHTVIQYALWVRRYLEEQTNAHERLAQGFEEMPEVRAVLKAHLNPANDPSLAIRAVYGQWFPWLALLDERWAREHVTRIFPLNEEEQAYFEAAWNAYVALNRPYDNAFDLLREQYGYAVRRIGHQKGDKPWHADPDKRLAEHLMVFYWSGKLPLGDSLLTTFWEQAPEALRGHALEFVGRALNQTKGPLPEEILGRLKHLWASRLEQARKSPSPSNFAKEMTAFGWWFVSAKFDPGWALDQLIASLQIASQTEPAHMVLERLAETAQTHPLKSVKCLKMIAEADTEGWELYAGRDYIRQILQLALEVPNARQEAERVIHYLGSRGFLDYRDLLRR